VQTLPAHASLIRHLLRPARGGAAAVVIIFALLLSLASRGGLIAIPLAILVLSWFFKYAYILFDHTSRGFDDPPVLDINMVNPANEQRPLGQVFILALVVGATYLAFHYVGAPAGALMALVCIFFLPASIAILGLEGNIFKAAYPVAWIRMMHGLGILYGAVLLLILVEFLVLGLLSKLGLWPSIDIAISMFFVLSVFSVLGGALYDRRLEMGLETYVSPERTEEKQRKEELKHSEALVTEAYGLMRVGSHVKCWELLQRVLAERGNRVDDYHWLCEHISSWDDPRYLTRLTEEHVSQLLIVKKTGEALDLVATRLRADPSFRPKTAADTLSLAQLAAHGGGTPRVARTLLSDFATRFPGDPRVSVAQALARHLGSDTH
jgi:hypothetical protein